jgi:hypothetical protein
MFAEQVAIQGSLQAMPALTRNAEISSFSRQKVLIFLFKQMVRLLFNNRKTLLLNLNYALSSAYS